MAPRESQKKASLKWDKENMTTLGCKVKKEDAVMFKTYCSEHGKTSNTVLKEYVDWCIGATGASRRVLALCKSNLFGDTSQVELPCEETETEYLVRCPECNEEIALSKSVGKTAICKCGLNCTMVPR